MDAEDCAFTLPEIEEFVGMPIPREKQHEDLPETGPGAAVEPRAQPPADLPRPFQ